MSDKLGKIVQKYRGRYKYNLADFNQFLVTKVEVDSYQSGAVVEYIRKTYPDIYQFQQTQFRFFLNVIAAVQKGCQIEKMSQEEIKQFEKIKFAGKAKNKSRIQDEEKQIEKPIEEPKKQQSFSQEPKKQQPAIQERKIKQSQFKYEQISDDEETTAQFGVKSQHRNEELISSQLKTSKLPERLNTIEQEERTDEVKLKNSNQPSFSYPMESKQYSVPSSIPSQSLDIGLGQKIRIEKFEKTGQDLINPVIKYQIRYNQKFITWRRYSQIERLMIYLRRKYEGIALPDMPPKEGIKGGISQLWSGVDDYFLLERRLKLQAMFNRLLDSKFVGEDDVLGRFLEDEDFQVELHVEDEYSYMKMFTGLTDIVFNAKEIKDYGLAYYNYVSEYKNKPLNTDISKEFERLQPTLQVLKETNIHRNKMNQNFDKRRQIMYLVYEKKQGDINQPVKTDFDIMLELAVTECDELITQYQKYVELKSSESWLGFLLKQKLDQAGTKSYMVLEEDEKKLKERIKHMEDNLMKTISEFEGSKKKMFNHFGAKMIEWRSKIHP